jgi:hypothetical protein
MQVEVYINSTNGDIWSCERAGGTALVEKSVHMGFMNNK